MVYPCTTRAHHTRAHIIHHPQSITDAVPTRKQLLAAGRRDLSNAIVRVVGGYRRMAALLGVKAHQRSSSSSKSPKSLDKSSDGAQGARSSVSAEEGRGVGSGVKQDVVENGTTDDNGTTVEERAMVDRRHTHGMSRHDQQELMEACWRVDKGQVQKEEAWRRMLGVHDNSNIAVLTACNNNTTCIS